MVRRRTSTDGSLLNLEGGGEEVGGGWNVMRCGEGGVEEWGEGDEVC